MKDGRLAAVRILTAISAILGVMCASLALALSREHDRGMAYRIQADCLRSLAEEDRVPQDKECESPARN